MLFTESEWYRRLIEAHRGPANRAPIVVWPYPIDPHPGGPLAAAHDLLIYEKSGVSRETVERLQRAWPRHVRIRYGRYRREELAAAARRSRVCAYLSDDDRGPLALGGNPLGRLCGGGCAARGALCRARPHRRIGRSAGSVVAVGRGGAVFATRSPRGRRRGRRAVRRGTDRRDDHRRWERFRIGFLRAARRCAVSPPLPPGEGRGEGNPGKRRLQNSSPLQRPLTSTLSRRERGT